MDLCAGIWSTAKACMLVDSRRTVVGCYVDCELLTTVETDLVLAFVSQVLNSKSSISGSAEVSAAAEIFKVKRAARLVNKRAVL